MSHITWRQWLVYLWKLVVQSTVAHYCEGRGYQAASLVLVNYESVRKLLLSSFKLNVEIRRVTYASLAAFSRPDGPPRKSDGVLQVCAVSRQVPRKGLDVMIRALARLASEGRRFEACVAGPGPVLESHRRLARELAVDHCLQLPGFVEDAYALIQAAHIFVLPSLEEGSGSVSVLEAMQAGCAIVASSCDGIPEDLTHEENALLVPPGDVDALADALRRLLTDRRLRQWLGENARHTYETKFSADALSATLSGVYAELLARRA